MLRTVCKSKIHRASVTESNLNYVGSITIDRNLMDQANLLEYEQVHVVNNNNGARFVTYVIEGERDSGVICLNGAASRLVQVNDCIIILSFAALNEVELEKFSPVVIHVNKKNQVISITDAITAGQEFPIEEYV